MPNGTRLKSIHHACILQPVSDNENRAPRRQPPAEMPDLDALLDSRECAAYERQMRAMLFGHTPRGDELVASLGMDRRMLLRDYVATGIILRNLSALDMRVRLQALTYLEAMLRRFAGDGEARRRIGNNGTAPDPSEALSYVEAVLPLLVRHSRGMFDRLRRAPFEEAAGNGPTLPQLLEATSPAELWLGYHYCEDSFATLSAFQQELYLRQLQKVAGPGDDVMRRPEFGALLAHTIAARSLLEVFLQIASRAREHSHALNRMARELPRLRDRARRNRELRAAHLSMRIESGSGLNPNLVEQLMQETSDQDDLPETALRIRTA